MNVKIRKSILIAILAFAIVMLLEITSDAASLTVSPSTVNVGESFSVNVTGIPDEVYGLQCTISVEGSGCNPEIFMKADNNMKPVSFTAKKAGTFTISVSNMEAYREDYSKIEVPISNSSIVVKDATPQPPAEEKKLSDIVISTKPTKTTYIEGESFDKSGMVVTAKYSDNSSTNVTNYTVSPSGALTTNNKSVAIKYTEGGVTKETSQAITVNAKPQDTNTNANTSRNNTTGKNNTVANNTIEPEVVNPTFRAVNEKVYAVNSCNVRSSCSTATNNNKIGSLEKDELVIRTGVSSEWSKIVFNGKDAYVATKLLTTTPPDDEENTVEENTVENEISNELDTIKSEVGVLPEVGNNVSVQLFFVTTMISISIISSFIYLKIKEK